MRVQSISLPFKRFQVTDKKTPGSLPGVFFGSAAHAAEKGVRTRRRRGREHRVGGPRFHNHPAVHEDDAVGPCGKAHFVRNDEHRHMLFGQLQHDGKHLARQLRVQCRSGFVKAQHLRMHGQRPRNLHALRLPA